jgi:hypothetical protein
MSASLASGWLGWTLASLDRAVVQQAGLAAAVETLTAPPSDALDATIAESSASRSERLVLTGSQDWDAATRRGLDEALALLPATVLADIGNPSLGPLYVLVNADGMTLSGRQPYGRAANFYSTIDGRNELVLYPGQSAITVLHELGHAFNLRHAPPGAYAQVYLQPEMQDFMAAAGWQVLTSSEVLHSLRDQTKVDLAHEGPAVWTGLSRNDPLEDFANSFALYFAAPEELRTLSSARHAWFEAHFGYQP